jgi:hypothetical protein
VRQTRAASWLPVMIRLTAVGYLLFFVPDLVFAITHRANALFDWGEGGDAIAVMFATVYIVWGLFLFASAKAQLANRLFLDFNLAANSAHFGVMLVMAVAMRDERRHLASGRRPGHARVAHHGPFGGVLASGPTPLSVTR